MSATDKYLPIGDEDGIFEGAGLELGAIDGRSIIDPSSNPLLPLQWYAAGSTSASVVDSRASQVWGDYTGRGVSIAVIDIGFQSAHVDLAAQLGSGALGAYSASNDHATQVTGVVGADAGNGVGIAGIAYGADVEAVALNYLSATTQRSDVAAAISTGANSDVVNASWGYRSQFQDNFRDAAFPALRRPSPVRPPRGAMDWAAPSSSPPATIANMSVAVPRWTATTQITTASPTPGRSSRWRLPTKPARSRASAPPAPRCWWRLLARRSTPAA